MAEFVLTSVSGKIPDVSVTDGLGLLRELIGTWEGPGFNQIWRPHQIRPGRPGYGGAQQDRFLELNETLETITFKEIPGAIPNRGLLQVDINLYGLTYTQEVSDAHADNGTHPGIHLEPGLWLNVPRTENPQDLPTVARLATIPHGTSILMQGSAFSFDGQPPIAPESIVPFPIGDPGHPLPSHDFPEMNLSIPSAFRTPPQDIPNVTQAWVDNPNVVLNSGLAGKHVTHTTTLHISTRPLNPPGTGGGTSNIAFLQGAAGGPNADAARVDAIFWIERYQENGQTKVQLQYTQKVILDFNGLSWPHVSVATLQKKY
ncbi:heme-binding protein [Burkholderia ubonensis]|uniref:heme-binding protein n=1 Tax=Burkholderia ubonensis TaxID=101571 RepID=UPI000AB26597|nr:heme-binding protein [Burkholderia ubonensis]